MQPRFTRAEYWILDLAFDAGHQLAWLNPEKDIEQMYNRPSHGLARHDLVSTLEGLFNAGLIECTGADGSQPMITQVFLQSALDDPQWIYRLTVNGGAAWESFGRPNWNRFIKGWLESDSDTWTCECADRRWLEYYLSCLAISESLPDLGSIEFRELKPWPATYWKTLPLGWQISLHRPDALNSIQFKTNEQYLHDWPLFNGVCHIRDGWNRWR